MAKVILQFSGSVGRFRKGDIAGFEPELAQQILDNNPNLVTRHGEDPDQDKTVDPDPASGAAPSGSTGGKKAKANDAGAPPVQGATA